MVCGYPTGNGCVVCSDLLTSDCVIFAWVVSSTGFNFAQTNLCCRGGLFLYAITGGSGKIRFRILLFWINFQCFFVLV